MPYGDPNLDLTLNRLSCFQQHNWISTRHQVAKFTVGVLTGLSPSLSESMITNFMARYTTLSDYKEPRYAL